MVDIVQALKDYLKSVADIQSFVGTGPDARVYFDQGRLGVPTLPLITLTETAGEPIDELNYYSPSLFNSTYRVASWGKDRPEANQLCETVRQNLDRQHGVWPPGLYIHEVAVFLGRETNVIQPQAKGGQVIYESTITYDIWHAVEAIANGQL